MLNSCAEAHTYIREFSEENSKLKVPHYFSGAFKPSKNSNAKAASLSTCLRFRDNLRAVLR